MVRSSLLCSSSCFGCNSRCSWYPQFKTWIHTISNGVETQDLSKWSSAKSGDLGNPLTPLHTLLRQSVSVSPSLPFPVNYIRQMCKTYHSAVICDSAMLIARPPSRRSLSVALARVILARDFNNTEMTCFAFCFARLLFQDIFCGLLVILS